MNAPVARRRSPWTLLTLAAALVAAPLVAHAQSGEPEQVQDGLEENNLQEKKVRTAKAEPADPDPTQAGKVETRRKEIRELLNKFQEEVGHKADDLTPKDAKDWDKVVAKAESLVSGFSNDDEKFLEAHREALGRYQTAFDLGKADETSKIAKEVAKIRADYLGKLDKVAKAADKVKAEWAKLEERIKKNAEK